MPIYEYECLRCGLNFEFLVRSNAKILTCPRCQKKNLKRLISAFSFNSKDASGNITSTSSGCASCSSQNCSSCQG